MPKEIKCALCDTPMEINDGRYSCETCGYDLMLEEAWNIDDTRNKKEKKEFLKRYLERDIATAQNFSDNLLGKLEKTIEKQTQYKNVIEKLSL